MQSCTSAVTFSKNRLYAACSDLPQLSSSLRWTYDASRSSLTLAFALPAPAVGWAAWAINPAPGGGMVGAQSLIAYRQSDGHHRLDPWAEHRHGRPQAQEEEYTWSIECCELGCSTSNGSNYCKVSEDIQVHRPSLVLPSCVMSTDRLYSGSCWLGNWSYSWKQSKGV